MKNCYISYFSTVLDFKSRSLSVIFNNHVVDVARGYQFQVIETG